MRTNKTSLPLTDVPVATLPPPLPHPQVNELVRALIDVSAAVETDTLKMEHMVGP